MEVRCRQYDSVIAKFSPTVVGVTWHPSFALPGKTPQTRIMIKRALETAFELADLGEKPALCLGGKAFELLMPTLDGNVKRWQRGFWRLEQ